MGNGFYGVRKLLRLGLDLQKERLKERGKIISRIRVNAYIK